MHLIYTRFWYKVMRDLGLVKGNEPVKRLLTQGMVTNRVEGTSDWKAMSKSLGNGVDPDEMIKTYGADATRMFVLFAAPAENELRWSESGIEGSVRFLRRVWGMVERWRETLDRRRAMPASKPDQFSDGARALRRKTHQTIARVTDDFEKLDLNTNVAALMELSNALGEFNIEPSAASPGDVFAAGEAIEALVVMLAPFSPHVAEEMWESLGHAGGLVQNPGVWPQAEPELARKEELEIPVQVNGKLRAKVVVAPDISEADLRTIALAESKVQSLIDGHEVVKVIVVPRRLVNVVMK
jgi:leucyl-tRNA synthetase